MASSAISRSTVLARLCPAPLRLLLVGFALLAAACQPIYRDHGYAPTEAELAAVVVGKDTRDTVTEAVGRPSASGLLNDDQWFYVQSRYRSRGAKAAARDRPPGRRDLASPKAARSAMSSGSGWKTVRSSPCRAA